MFKLLVLVLAVTTVYLLVCVILFVFQRSLIYYPQARAINHPNNTLTLTITNADLVISTRSHQGSKAIIYLGGNAEDVSLNLPMFSAAFPDHAIYLMHYRGYGGSSGTASEYALQQDALALFDKIHQQHQDIVIIGRSLGSGIACYVAHIRPVYKLVLITPFASLQEVAAHHFPYLPTYWLLLDKYESWLYVRQINMPTLILVAEQDEVIPRSSSDQLYSHFKNGVALYKVLVNTQHNNIAEHLDYLPLLQDFINH